MSFSNVGGAAAMTGAEANSSPPTSAEIRSEERRVGKEWRSLCDWSSDVCSSDLDEDRSVVATLEHQPAQAQVEAGFQLLAFAVTFEAMRLEDRADVLLERRWSSGDDGRGSKQQPADQRGNQIGRASCRERVEITV